MQPQADPGGAAGQRESSWTNGSNMRSRSAAVIGGPALETETASMAADRPRGHPDRGQRGGVLEGVAEQVDHDQAQGLGRHGHLPGRVEVDLEVEPLPAGHVLEVLDHRAHHPAQVGGGAAVLLDDLGGVDQVVDHPLEPAGLAQDPAQVLLALLGVQPVVAGEQQLAEPEDAGERGAQLVETTL